MRLVWTKNSRKHRIGHAHARFVIENYEPQSHGIDEHGEQRLLWVGRDSRGRELEIVAVLKPDQLIVIHVQPEYTRRAL